MNIRFFAIGLVICFGALSALGDNEHFSTLKVGTETYTNVTVTSSSATEIFFTHSRGLGNAKLKNLEAAVQKVFAFDAAKANAQQVEQAKANALYRSEERRVGKECRSRWS